MSLESELHQAVLHLRQTVYDAQTLKYRLEAPAAVVGATAREVPPALLDAGLVERCRAAIAEAQRQDRLAGAAEALSTWLAQQRSSGAAGATATTGPSSHVERLSGEPLFRYDNRPPEELVDFTLSPWGGSASLEEYVLHNRPSNFEGTTRIENPRQLSPMFAGRQYQYIFVGPGGIDVNRTMPGHRYEHEQEVAFPGGVRPVAVRRIRPDGRLGPAQVLPRPENGPERGSAHR